MSSRLHLTCAAALLAAAGWISTASAGEPEWIRQFGTDLYEDARGVAAGPDGRVHVVGGSEGSFAGANKGGYGDAYVITFDRDGTELWRRQPGTTDQDYAIGVATGTDGSVFVVGYSYGALGGSSKGDRDAFVIKFDRDGNELWKRQPGTSDWDGAEAVATDADGNVYVVGETLGSLGGASKGSGDAFVIKFDRDGRYLWKRQPGTTESEEAYGVATDADGNVYVVGYTAGALGGAFKGSINDPFVIKFDRDGRYLWKRQPGTASYDYAVGVATDADSNVYVVGDTGGALGGAPKGYTDVFVIKYDRDGRIVWRKQPGTTEFDSAKGVATDTDGNIYVVGHSNGSFGGAVKGGMDAFVVKFGSNGSILWSDQPGTISIDDATGVATDTDGNVYLVGTTEGALPGNAYLGWDDAFLIKYGPNGPQ